MLRPGDFFFSNNVLTKNEEYRRQSGASNRILGLESDTPSSHSRRAYVSFYAGEGDGDLAFPRPLPHGRLRGTATMGNKGKRDAAPSPLRRRHEITSHSSRLEIYYAGRRRTNCQKEDRRGLLRSNVTRQNAITTIAINFCCCYFLTPRIGETEWAS